MIERLIEVLETRLDLTPEEIADILWLAQRQWQLEPWSGEPGDDAATAEAPLDQGQDESMLPDPARLPRPSSQASPLPPAGLQSRRPPSTDIAGDDVDLGGSPITIPDAPALRGTLGLLRALKPLLRQVPSPDRTQLNETATAQSIAETNIWVPRLDPEQEPWLELTLVIDASPSMLIWRRTVREMQRLLRQCGAFRDVRLWSLDVVAGQVQLRPGYGPTAARLSPCSPKELIDPRGRRLIWLVSDCIDNRWQTGVMTPTLSIWASRGPMALVQVLPEWLWERTSLRTSPKLRLHGLEPGSANRALQVQRRDRWRRTTQVGIKMPVLTLEPAVVQQWSQMVIGQGAAAGLMFPEGMAQADWQRPAMTSQERIETFELFSSLTARRLAGLLSGCPVVNLPIIRIVQAAMVRDSTQVHVAEVLLGGLLKPTQAPDHFANQDEVDYVFYDRETQRQLLQETPPEDTFKTLSKWIEHRMGKSLNEFVAVLADPAQDPTLAAQTLPFAGIALEVLIRQEPRYVPVAEAYLDRWLRQQLQCSLEAFVEQFQELAQAPAFGQRISPVAEILIYVLRAKGDHYGQVAEDLKTLMITGRVPEVVAAEVASHELRPEDLTWLEFETAQLIEADAAAEWPPLQERQVEVVTVILEPAAEATTEATAEMPSVAVGPFSFEVATVERSLFRQWTVRKQRRQGQRYIERLENGVFIVMVAIPGGSFVIGSPEDEPGRFATEGPQRQVTVPTFLMGRYPVTQAQWQIVAGLPQVARELAPEPSRFKGDQRPVEGVSWFEAVEFCARLSTHTGRPYRLPSEAEWEYACRAGTTTPFHFGETITTDVANYDGRNTYNGGPEGEYRGETTAVDHFTYANGFGLSDMHGNVLEWCQDHWHGSYEGAPTDGRAWEDADVDDNKRRVIRGGCWGSLPRNCRSAFRSYGSPRDSYDDLGFRVVCVAPRTL